MFEDVAMSSLLEPEHAPMDDVVPDLTRSADLNAAHLDKSQGTQSEVLTLGESALGAGAVEGLAAAGPAAAVRAGGLLFLERPQRIYDSRDDSRLGKLSGGHGSIGLARTITVPFDGSLSGVFALFGNLATTQQDGAGFLTLWPGNTAWPGLSSINFVPGVDLANWFFVALGTGNTILLAASQNTHVIIDITGLVST
jgi:hypothetical protein